MALTRERLLRELDRLYRFGAGSPTAPTDINVEGSVQVVHDVSREAELGAIVTDLGACGFFQVGIDNTHAGTGDTIESFVDPYTAMDSNWGDPGGRWCWLFDYGVTASIAVQYATLSLGIGLLGNALTTRDLLIRSWAATVRSMNDVGGQPSACVSDIDQQVDTPLPIFPNSKLGFRSQSGAASGAGIIRLQTICWVGPFGVYPPGLA